MANLLAYGENVIGSDVGSSGGHIIENSSGVDMTQRNKLQFVGNGVTITDDSTNDRTVVTIAGGGSSSGLTILSYGTTTWNDFVTAYNNNNVVFCKASITDSNPSSGTQSRHAVLSYVDDPANPTRAEFLYPKTTDRHDYNHQTDQMIVYILDSTNGWSCSTRYTSTNIAPKDGIAYTYNSTKGGTIYLSTPSITGSFSDATNYTVGDYIYHDNTLYKCTTAHTAGAWDASHFTQTTVGDELKDAGHEIINKNATEMTKRNGLQFTGGLNVTDDSNNNRTVIDDNYEIIPWTTWKSYSDAQKAQHPNAIVTDAPDCDGTLEIENMHLAWSNPNPTASKFGEQDISLNTNDYDFVYLHTNLGDFIVKKGSNFRCNEAQTSPNSYTMNSFRTLVYIDDVTYHVNDAVKQNANSTRGTENSYFIPLEIYTFKKKLTAKIKAIAHDVSTSASKCMLSDGVTSVEDVLLRRVYKGSISTGTIAGGGQGNQSINLGATYSNPTIIINGTSNRLLYGYVLSGQTLTVYYRNVTSDSGSSDISIDVLIKET